MHGACTGACTGAYVTACANSHSAHAVLWRSTFTQVACTVVEGGRVTREGGRAHLGEGYTLGGVEGFLLGEGVGVELLLQLLVGEVDAQLLEGVGLEYLKAEDVQHADRGAALAADGGVDAKHQVVEEVRVDGL